MQTSLEDAMNTNTNLEKALEDINFLKSFIENKQRPNRKDLNMNVIINTIGLLFSGYILFVDFNDPNIVSNVLHSANNSQEFGLNLIFFILSILVIGLLFSGYFIWKKSKLKNTNLNDYINVAIPYMRIEIFLSDLIIKFLILSIFIASKNSQLLGAVFVIFIVDYLLRNSYFALTKSIRLISAAILVFISAKLIVSNSASLTLPLMIFIILNITSIARLMYIKSALKLREMSHE